VIKPLKFFKIEKSSIAHPKKRNDGVSDAINWGKNKREWRKGR